MNERTCAENARLRNIIRRASTKFCEDGPDGQIAAAMFTILAEASTPNGRCDEGLANLERKKRERVRHFKPTK